MDERRGPDYKFAGRMLVVSIALAVIVSIYRHYNP